MIIEVHHYIHFTPDLFTQAVQGLRDDLSIFKENVMGKFQDLESFLPRLDAATSAIAGELQGLRDQIAGGVSPDEAATLQTQLDAAIAKLEAMGKPNDPLPADGGTGSTGGTTPPAGGGTTPTDGGTGGATPVPGGV